MNPTQKLIEAALDLVHVIDTTKPCHRHVEEAADDVREAVRGLREAGEPVAWWLKEWRSEGCAARARVDPYPDLEAWMPPDTRVARLQRAAPPSPAPQPEPMFWVRLRSDGGYEGPLHNDSIEQTRKQSGAWHPLFLGAAPQPAQDGGDPSLVELVQRFRGWEGPEISGRVRNQKQSAQDGGEVVAWTEGRAIEVAHAAGFAGKRWHLGPEELARLLTVAATPPAAEPVAADAGAAVEALQQARDIVLAAYGGYVMGNPELSEADRKERDRCDAALKAIDAALSAQPQKAP